MTAALETLIAKDEIYDALVRYCRGIDRRDADLVRSAYHEDAADNHGYTVVERGWDLAELADRDNPEGFPQEWESTSHLLTNVLIRVEGDVASSEGYYTATMRCRHDDGRYNLVSIGRYIDRWERRDGGPFKIASRIVITDSIETDAVDGTWPGPDQEVPKGIWGGPEMVVPPDVPLGSATAEDPSYQATPPLR
jgi:hypothetical protein